VCRTGEIHHRAIGKEKMLETGTGGMSLAALDTMGSTGASPRIRTRRGET